MQESSGASGPHGCFHLSLPDAIELRDRFAQFIDSAPERWTDGERFLEEGYRIVAERRKRAEARGE